LEKRTERIPLGSYDLGLAYLRRERVACEDLIEQGKSPKKHRDQQHEQKLRTLRQAVREFFDWAGGTADAKPARWKSQETRDINYQIKRLYLDPSKVMDYPLQKIECGGNDAANQGTCRSLCCYRGLGWSFVSTKHAEYALGRVRSTRNLEGRI
jgi:hypothetical protein